MVPFRHQVVPMAVMLAGVEQDMAEFVSHRVAHRVVGDHDGVRQIRVSQGEHASPREPELIAGT